MNHLLADPHRLISPRYACVGLAFCALFALLVGRLWWFGEASTWAGFIRTSLFLCLLLSVLDSGCLRQFSKQNYLLWLVVVLLIYVASSSALLGDGKTLRRVLLLMAFIVAISHVAHHWQYAWKKLLGCVGVASALASAVTLWNLWDSGLLDLGNRAAAISGSGVAGLAEFENSVLASLQMSFSVVLIAWLYLTTKSRVGQGFWLLCCIVAIVYLFGTLGRTGWLAAVTAVVVLIAVMANKKQRYAFWGGMCLTIALAIVFFHERIAYELFSRQLTHRDEIWRMVFGVMPGKWLFGHGADASVEHLLGVQSLGGYETVINHAHSLYVEVIFNYGVIGLAGFITILIGSVRRLWLQRGEPLCALWLAILCGAVPSIGVDFSSFLSTPNLVWLWVWLPVAYACALPTLPRGSELQGAKAGD